MKNLNMNLDEIHYNRIVQVSVIFVWSKINTIHDFRINVQMGNTVNCNNKASIEPSLGDIVSGTYMYARSYFLLSCHTNCFTHYIHAPKQGDKRGKTQKKTTTRENNNNNSISSKWHEWKAKGFFCFHFWDVIIMNIIGAYMHTGIGMNKRTDKQDESPKQKKTASN